MIFARHFCVMFFAALMISSVAVAQSSAPGNPVLDPSAMDTTVNPCQDFYQYSCGNWLKRTTIPSDQSDWARSFSVVYDQNLATLRDVLTDYARGHYVPATTYQQKLGAYYSSCMNTAEVEKETPPPFKTSLARSTGCKTSRTFRNWSRVSIFRASTFSFLSGPRPI